MHFNQVLFEQQKNHESQVSLLFLLRSYIYYLMKSSEHSHSNPPLCTICLENEPSCSLNNCPHTFCYRCIKRWSKTKNTCPLCRRKFSRMRHRNQVIEVVQRRRNRVPHPRAPAAPPVVAQRRMWVWPVGVMFCSPVQPSVMVGMGGLMMGQPIVGFPVMMGPFVPQ